MPGPQEALQADQGPGMNLNTWVGITQFCPTVVLHLVPKQQFNKLVEKIYSNRRIVESQMLLIQCKI